MTAAKTTEPDFGPGVLPLRVELSAEIYGQLDQIAETWHIDSRALATQLIERGVTAIWTASPVASLTGIASRKTGSPRRRGAGSKPRVTDEQLIRIRHLAAEGIPVKVIAEQLDLSAQTVRNHVGKLRDNHLTANPSQRMSA